MFGFLQNCNSAIFVGLKRIFVLIQTVSESNIVSTKIMIKFWILMHLQMQRDVCLDNLINLRQFILRYTVGNPTSLRNVSFHWLTSEYMQLASGFMQLTPLDE